MLRSLACWIAALSCFLGASCLFAQQPARYPSPAGSRYTSPTNVPYGGASGAAPAGTHTGGGRASAYSGGGNVVQTPNYPRQTAPYSLPYGQPAGLGRESGPPIGRAPVLTAQAPMGSTRAPASGGAAYIGQQQGQQRDGRPANNAPYVQSNGAAGNGQPPATNRGSGSGLGNLAPRRPTGLPPQQPAPVQPPFGPLTQQQQKYIDTLLAYWEFSTKDLERYQCTFQLWRYDPVFGPRDPNTPIQWSQGVIKYEAPDRGLYKVDWSKIYRRPENPGEKVEWKPEKNGDHWVCDGKSLFEFNWNRKLMIERALPPHVQGVHIANGPLPFLLKAKAAQVKARFWVRGLPSRRPNEYWVEAYPKRRSDAANFQKLHIVLNKSYLPKALVVFNPGFRPDRPARTTYEFANIETNPDLPWFGRQFIVTSPPGLDWKSIEEPIPQAGGAVAPQQSRRP